MSRSDRIGRYEVLSSIDSGGMAELLLAKHVGMEGFEKVVAIKRIHPELSRDPDFVDMLRDEARLVARLSHPNIVQIYDFGKADDRYFIAMEYVPGRNLGAVAKKARERSQRIPHEYLARAMAEVASALHYAHTRVDVDGEPLAIVHRDVTPQNILLSFSGGVKLVDFGIAKAATRIAHTRTGARKGRFGYMSPEQIRDEEIDGRSDVFSAGIVLFELACGRRPFDRPIPVATMRAIVHEPHPDPRDLDASIPAALADTIRRALMKDPDRRFQSARELQLALEDFLSSSRHRHTNAFMSRWLRELFADEIEPGSRGALRYPGIGEVILPAKSHHDDGDEATGATVSEEHLEPETSETQIDVPVIASVPVAELFGEETELAPTTVTPDPFAARVTGAPAPKSRPSLEGPRIEPLPLPEPPRPLLEERAPPSPMTPPPATPPKARITRPPRNIVEVLRTPPPELLPPPPALEPATDRVQPKGVPILPPEPARRSVNPFLVGALIALCLVMLGVMVR